MKVMLVLFMALLLSACASKNAPKDLVARLDASTSHYNSTGCKSARYAAENYDDNLAPRLGLGVALTYLVGALASPLAMLADNDQSDNKSTVIADLKIHCQRVTASN